MIHQALVGSAVFMAVLMPLRDSCSCQAVQRRVRDPAFERTVERLHPCWVGCDVRPPKLVEYVPPVWPRHRCSCTNAVVVVESVVDRTGRVAATNVVVSVPGLDEAAVAAVRRWRYEPALLHGAPIAVVLTVTVSTFAPGATVDKPHAPSWPPVTSNLQHPTSHHRRPALAVSVDKPLAAIVPRSRHLRPPTSNLPLDTIY